MVGHTRPRPCNKFYNGRNPKVGGAPPVPWIGESLPRLEDRRLVVGKGRYVSDITVPNQLTMVLVRSQHAHARITGIETDRAKSLAGVFGVFTAQDLPAIMKPMLGLVAPGQTPLAIDTVRYVGEPIAVVLANNRYVGEDAANEVFVHYDPLPVVLDAESQDSPPLFAELGTNAYLTDHKIVGEGAAALVRAQHVVSVDLRLGRVSGQPMEPRGIVAVPSEDDSRLTVYYATQGVHSARRRIQHMLHWDEERITVIAPDVGGGFGVKNGAYPEEILASYLAIQIGRPIKWVADRMEEFIATNQERQQVHHAKLGVDESGRILCLVDDFVQDNGAYPQGGAIVFRSTLLNMPGPYQVPNLEIHARSVLTNKVPIGPYRGAGRPQGHFVIERLLDQVASRLGMTPAEIRRRNLVRPDQFPYATGLGTTYDSGNYPEVWDALLTRIGYQDFPQEQQAARAQGRYIGLGVSAYVEISAGDFEKAKLCLLSDGTVEVATGAASQGQGHETALSQIVAERLEIPFDRIRIVEGDTRRVDQGIGTFGSRTMVLAGSAAAEASLKMKQRLVAMAADLLATDLEAITWQDGSATMTNSPYRSISLEEIARALSERDQTVVAEAKATSRGTYGFGAHAVKVEVDPETGAVRILRYLMAHDGGRLINPLLVDGQMVGAAVQGIGTALFESVEYDQDGQPTNTSLMDYLLPTATDTPDFEIVHMNSPAPGSSEGFKGVGEAGIIPSLGVLCQAVEDALRPFGAAISQTPITPQAILSQLKGGLQ